MGRDVENLKKGVDICANGIYVTGMSRKKRAKMGRPPKAAADKRSYRATVRLTPEQYRRLTEGAAKAGVTLSTYIVSRLEA
jgi:predicted HicB family RNase H-like nuclease